MKKKTNPLQKARIFRIVFACVWIVLITLPFVFVSKRSSAIGRVILKTQFGPSVMGALSGSVIALAVLLLMTLAFGRVYCSFLCPLGIWQDVAGRIAGIFKNRKQRRTHYTRPLNWLRYVILGLVIGFLVFGISYPFAFLDPYSIYGRFASQLFGNAAKGIGNLLSGIFPYSIGIRHFANFQVWSFVVAVFLFCLVTLMSSFGGRIYCNSICPVGSLLSIISPVSMFRLEIDESKCKHCMLCQMNCKSHCIDSKISKIDYSRCVVCFDCADSCTSDAFAFKFTWGSKKRKVPTDGKLVSGGEKPADPAFRKTLIALGTGIASAAAVSVIAKATGGKSKPAFGENEIADGSLPAGIVPPGGKSILHIKNNCTACQACISACPNEIIKPAVGQYGIEGFMMPIISYDHGFCDYDCHSCSTVCPSGAIERTTLDEKRKIQIGEVRFNAKNCLVIKEGIDCGNCSRHCPTGTIKLVTLTNGRLFPHITRESLDTCIGCGACEYVCPADPKGMTVIPKSVQTVASKIN